MMPTVSVIIPAYNAVVYIAQTLESVLRQTYTDFEVIIVNDGSTDGIVQWAAHIKDDRVQLISQANAGPNAARNAGLAKAQGQYIAFLDADDIWEPTKLAKQVDCLDRHPEVGLVYSWVAIANDQGQVTGRIFKSHHAGPVLEPLVERNFVECPSSVVVRRTCFDQAGGFDETIFCFEDWEMWIRIAAHYPFAVIAEPLVQYRQIQNSNSKNCKLMEASCRQVIETVFQRIPPEWAHLKNRSYGHANLVLAWKALQSVDQDYQLALHYRAQAIRSFPALRFTKEWMRLSVAIALMKYCGPTRYERLLEIFFRCRTLGNKVFAPNQG